MARNSQTIAAAAIAGLMLTSCATTGLTGKTSSAANPTLDTQAATPLDRYRAVTRELIGQLDLAQHPGGRMSETQKVAVTDQMRHWAEGDGTLRVDFPANDPADGNSARMAQSITAFLIGLGANADRVQIGRYPSDNPASPVRITFHGVEAVGPDCRKGWDSFSSTGSNRTTEHFGCAMAANLAAMISNPRDLDHPTNETPADAARRGVVFGKYRKGEATSAAKDEQASGNVSQAVK